MGSAQTAVDERVFLNIYDLHPANDWCCLYNFGFGLYHTGVQIRDQEFTFSQDGIFDTPPKAVPPEVRFRRTIEIGSFHGNESAVRRAISDLSEHFRPGSYHILKRNCNTFSNALCLTLTGNPIPGYINRMANIGAMFPALWPQALQNAPVSEVTITAANNFKAFSGSGYKMTGAGAPRAPATHRAPTTVEMDREFLRRQRLAKFEQPQEPEADSKDK
mmetsp:Transcript_8811/g.18283  ORF Transcript_8811/g.18283 Transcript_8811/m.18283 type:complete len:218 (+) Transcript_8811:345-998(+)|eukprot:CAMPEP_0118929938 /NCGR_PEP_ID=MMETSP1169-20130426/6793_1 /TAXON_ID=36882 /ORGANISM="Pyramimonas obovata, Strain CCMP722" /LENGTH=217 /DNA_ID=CAMNT_0006872215 /DNA_START=278 /DNA_END=931 /DNA_ORIENTATION=-